MPNDQPTKITALTGVDDLRFLAWIAYALAALFVILPLSDVALGVLPLRFGNMRWRIGTTGIVTGALLFPMIGAFLGLSASHVFGHRRMQYFIAGSLGLLALVLILVVGMFALDTMQVRREVDTRQRHLYSRAAIRGVVTQIMTIFVLGLMSVTSLRASLASARRLRARRKQEAESIVMARTAQPS